MAVPTFGPVRPNAEINSRIDSRCLFFRLQPRACDLSVRQLLMDTWSLIGSFAQNMYSVRLPSACMFFNTAQRMHLGVPPTPQVLRDFVKVFAAFVLFSKGPVTRKWLGTCVSGRLSKPRVSTLNPGLSLV